MAKKRLTTDDIPKEWIEGRPGKAAALSTDGRLLFSYNLCIGVTTVIGEKVLFNYTASGGGKFISKTTSSHVSKAYRASRSVNPDSKEFSELKYLIQPKFSVIR